MSQGTRTATAAAGAAAQQGAGPAPAPTPAQAGILKPALTIYDSTLLNSLPAAAVINTTAAPELKALMEARGIGDESNNPKRKAALEAWRTSQSGRADNTVGPHTLIQLAADSTKVGTVVSTDAAAGSLEVSFNGASGFSTVALADVKLFDPNPTKRAKISSALASDGSSVEMCVDKGKDIWMSVTIFGFADGAYDLRTEMGVAMSKVAEDLVRLPVAIDESGLPDQGDVVTYGGVEFTVNDVVVSADSDTPTLINIVNDAAPSGQWVEATAVKSAAAPPAAAKTPAAKTPAANTPQQDAVAAAHARLLAGTGGVAAVAGTGLTMLGSAGLGKHGVPGAHTTSALGAVAGVGHPPGSMGQMLAEMKAAGVGSTPAAPVAPASTVDHTPAWMAVLPGKWTAEQIRKQDLHLQAPPRPELGGTPIPGTGLGVQPFCGTYAIAVCPLPRDFCVRLASAKEPAVFTLGGIEFGKKASSNAKPLTNLSDFCIALSRYENWREQNGTWAPGEREEHNVYTTTILGYVSTYGFSAAMAYDELFRRHLFAGSNPAIQSWSGYDGRIWCECFMLPSNKPPPPPGPKPATAPTRAKPQPPPPPPGPKPLRGLQLTLSQLPFAEKDGAAGCRMFNMPTGCHRSCGRSHHCLGCGTANVSHAACPTCKP